jgi:hypothetical protein
MLVPCQSAHRVLDALGNLRQRHARLDPLLRPLPDLAMHLGAAPVVGEEVLVHAVQMALLLAGRPVRVLVSVLDNLAFGVGIVQVDFVDGDAGRRGLDLGATVGAALLLLARLALLLLFGGALGRAFGGAIVGLVVVVRVVVVYIGSRVAVLRCAVAFLHCPPSA